MSTMTITSPAYATGSSYLQNVAGATRALFAALVAVRPQTQAASTASVQAKADQVSIAKLYRMAASYDSVMPNLAQELRAIAQRA